MGLGINRTQRVNYCKNAYEVFQDRIFAETGHDCRVFVKEGQYVSIRTPGPPKLKYRQYLDDEKS